MKEITGQELAEAVDKIIEFLKIPRSKFYLDAGITSASLTQWRQGKYKPSKRAIASIINAAHINEKLFDELIEIIRTDAAGESELSDIFQDEQRNIVYWGRMTLEEIDAVKAMIRMLGGSVA